jgi:hypothetical protein
MTHRANRERSPSTAQSLDMTHAYSHDTMLSFNMSKYNFRIYCIYKIFRSPSTGFRAFHYYMIFVV